MKNALSNVVIESLENRQLMTAVNFTIDSTLSSIKIIPSYSIPAFGFSASMTPQKTGSDVAKYSGTIKTDLTAGALKFLSGSAFTALTTAGPYNPGATAANYAGQVAVPFLGTLLTAVRSFKFDATTPAAQAISSSGTFVGTTLAAKVTGGTVSYGLLGGSSASTSIIGKSSLNNITTTGKLTQSGKVLTLTLPISITLTYSTTISGVAATGTLKLAGSIVAKSTLAAAGTSTISGTVYKDVNKNGSKDSGDTVFSGVRIFLDLNGNGKYDTTDKSVLSATDGTFKFTGVVPGSYKVYEVVPATYTKSQPTAAFYSVSTVTGQTVGGLLFGNKK